MLKTSLTLLAAAAFALSAGSRAIAASVDDTRLGSSSGYVIDSTGAKWTLSGGYIYVNGVRDQHSYNVICLAYEGGRMWQENANHMWYEKTEPSDTWAPSGGTENSPLPPITASVANGVMKIRTDPQTVVGITAIGSNNSYPGSISVATDSYGNVSIPTNSLFGHYTYLISEFRKPMLLSKSANIAMLSQEVYYTGSYKGCCSDDYIYDIQGIYGANVSVLDWATLVLLQKLSPPAFSLFAKSLGNDLSNITYNGSIGCGGDCYYVVTTNRNLGEIESISSELFLTAVGPGYFARVAYSSYGPPAYTFNTIASVTVAVP